MKNSKIMFAVMIGMVVGFSHCGKSKDSKDEPTPNGGDQVVVKGLKLGEHAKYYGETAPVAGLPGDYKEAYVEKYLLKLDAETPLKLENYSAVSACVTGAKKEGPFVTIEHSGSKRISNDKIAYSDSAISSNDFGSASGDVLVTVTAYATGHCYSVSKEFAFVAKKDSKNDPFPELP